MSLQNENFLYNPHSSFQHPVPDPGTAPDVGPFVCVYFNAAWQPYLVGAALQLYQAATWQYTTDDQLEDLLSRATTLINLIGLAGECVPSEDGNVSITILAGNATASAVVSLSGTYITPPNILVSCDNIQLAATFSGATTTQFTANLTASVPVTADITATVAWAAMS